MSCRSSFALLATLALAIMTSPSLAQPPVAAPDAGVAPPAEEPVDGGVAPDAPTQPAEEQAPVEEPAPPTAEITADDAVDDGVDDDALMDELAEELTLDDAADESAPAPNAGGAPEADVAQEPRAEIDEESSLTLDEAVVHYSEEDAFRTGGGVNLIGEEELETYEYSNPESVLVRVPGVYVRSEDGYGLRPNIGMRGTRSERSQSVTLMEDGVLLGPAPYSAPAAYYFPLITRMVGVEVFKGPSAILYGPQTVGGAINLLTREVPLDASGQIDLSYGMYRSRKLHLQYGASNRWGGILFEGLDLYSAGYKEIDDTDDETGFHRNEFMVRSYVHTNPNGRIYNRLELKLGFSHERSNETYLGLADADFRADPYRRYGASQLDRMSWNRYQAELFHRLSVGERFDLRTVAYFHHFHRVWHKADHLGGGRSFFDVLTSPEDPESQVLIDFLRSGRDSVGLSERIMVVRNDREYMSQGVQTNASFRAQTGAVGHQLEAGIRLHYDSIDRDHTLEGFDTRSHQLVGDGGGETQTNRSLASTYALSAHAMYSLDVAGLRVTPGLRTEIIWNDLDNYLTVSSVEGTQAVVLPGLGASYAIRDYLSVFAGVHRGFAPVAPGQPAEVEPEMSLSVEAGLRARHEGLSLVAELSGFYNDYTNLLLTCAASAGCADALIGQQFNAGSANIGGIEATFATAFDLGRSISVPVRAAYTFTHARLRHVRGAISAPPDFAGAVDGDFVPYIPAHQASADLGLDWKKLGFRATGTYFGHMLEQAGQRGEVIETDDYFMLDLVGQYQMLERALIYVRFENVTNAQPLAARRPFGARPARPFQAQVGLKVDL